MTPDCRVPTHRLPSGSQAIAVISFTNGVAPPVVRTAPTWGLVPTTRTGTTPFPPRVSCLGSSVPR
ncbi:MAG: hypothetical protein U0470_07905 [Anaerolineae bacterium]